MNLKDMFKERVLRKDIRNTLVSSALLDEIKKTKDLLEKAYFTKYKVRKTITNIRASRYLARIYRKERYKLQNGKRYI